MAEDENQNEAKLHLKLLNAQDLKDVRFLGKMKTFAVTWIDPRFKKTTKTLTTSTRNPYYNHHLSFSLSLQTLQNPNSCITIQILSPSSPIHRERVLGTSIMSLGEVRSDEKVFTLQLWRSSGRAQGLLRVTAWIVCDLGFCMPVGCVTGIPVEGNSVQESSLIVDYIDVQSGYSSVVPSAPPDESDLVEYAPLMERIESHYVPSASVESNLSQPVPSPPPQLIFDEMSNLTQSMPSNFDDRNPVEWSFGSSSNSTGVVTSAPASKQYGGNVLRSLLVGMVGGAVAVATVLAGSNAG